MLIGSTQANLAADLVPPLAAGYYWDNVWGAPGIEVVSDVTEVAVTSLVQSGPTECQITLGLMIESLWEDAVSGSRAGFSPSGEFAAILLYDPAMGLPTSFLLANNNPSGPEATRYFILDNVWGASIAGPVEIVVSLSELSSFSDYGVCTGDSSSSYSSSSSTSTPATASASVVQSDVTRVTRSAVTANNSMMSQGLERFIGDREAGDDLASRNFNSFSFLPTLNANDGGIFGGGSFFAQSGSVGGAYRQVTFGEFDVQHESGSGTTLSFNGRMAWERSLNDDAMIAYFLGAEVNQSNIKGSYSGDQTRYGVTGGMYGYMALENDLFLSGYGSLGVGRSDLDITDGASTPSVITGDYSSRTASIGGKLSGSVDYDAYELRPSVGLNMVKTWIGDITLDNSGSAITSSVGDTTFAELIAKPEFIFPMEQQAGSNMVPVASAAPRFICERSDASGVVTKDCGGGVELGIDATSEDGMTNFNASVRFDRLGSVNRQGLNLQAELRF